MAKWRCRRCKKVVNVDVLDLESCSKCGEDDYESSVFSSDEEKEDFSFDDFYLTFN